MAEAAAFLVEVLCELRASIDALASHQSRAPDPAISDDLALALITGLKDVRRSIDKLADQQAEFQRDVESILSDIARDVGRASEHSDTLNGIERDVAIIADRYRPFESDLSPNLDD